MLSSGAENALLKTLEEPPDHVVFVLATTEPQKVVPTIRSRTQHFEFSSPARRGLGRPCALRSSATPTSTSTTDAIDYVLRQGGGSARDTLSALDLVAAAGGVPQGNDVAESIIRAIGDRDAARVIALVQEGLELGREPRTIGEDLLDLLRNAFLATMSAPLGHLNDQAQSTSNELGSQLGPAILTRSLEALGQTLVEMRQAPDPRVPLEVTLLRLSRGPETGDASALVETVERLEARISQLEAKVEAGVQVAPAAPPATTPAPPSIAPSSAAAPTQQATQSTTAAPPATTEPTPHAPRSPRSPRQQSAPPKVTSAPETHSPQPPAPQARARQTPSSEAPTSEAPVSQAPTSRAPEPEPQVPEPPPAAVGASSTEAPTFETVQASFGDQLDQLSQRVRARFKGGKLVALEGTTVIFGTPNAIHRDRCDDVKGDVEQALSAHFGQPMTVSVVIDDASSPPLDPVRPPTAAPKPAAGSAEDEDVGPVSEMADASEVSSRGVDRITDAFPGSEVINAPAD